MAKVSQTYNCLSIVILVVLASELAVSMPTEKSMERETHRPIEARLGGHRWKEQNALPEDGVFLKPTEMVESELWNLPPWPDQTMLPWLDTDSSLGGPYEPYNSPGLAEDLNIDVLIDKVTFAPPVVPPVVAPVHVVDAGGSSGGGGSVPNLWEDDEARMGSYTWITMAVVLVVFFKMTVIAIIIARRMHQRQHHSLSQSTNSSTVNIPSEFSNDQAHLVTPASIVYVDPNADSPAPLPNLFTPPPYSESLLAQSDPPPAMPSEAPPPYSG